MTAVANVAGASQNLVGSDCPLDIGLDDLAAFVRGAGLPVGVTERIRSGDVAALLQKNAVK